MRTLCSDSVMSMTDKRFTGCNVDRRHLCGMVWYGMVWYGLVRCGVVGLDLEWYGMVRYGTVWHGMVRYGIV